MHRQEYKRQPIGYEKYEYMDFGIIKTEEQAYVLGFLAADGNVGKKGNQIKIGLSPKDETHLWKLSYFLQGRHEHYETKQYRGSPAGSKTLFVSSEMMKRELVLHGVHPNKTLSLRPPCYLPNALQRHWIRGYFDGDGCIHIKNQKKHISNKTGKKTIRRGGYVIARLLGTFEVLEFVQDCFMKIHYHPMNIRECSNVYQLGYNGDHAIAFIDWLYRDANIFLDRKMILAEPFIRNSLVSSMQFESKINTVVTPQVDTSLLVGDMLWTAEEEAYLTKAYLTEPRKDIINVLKKHPWINIKHHASQAMGLKRPNELVKCDSYGLSGKRTVWRNEDDNYLRTAYLTKPKTDIIKQLNVTSWQSVKRRACHLMLKRPYKLISADYGKSNYGV
jgi:hypothetical protein